MARIERDSLGEREVLEDAYYGIETVRACENFPVSGVREPPEFIRAYLLLKKAAAQANSDLRVLDPVRGQAILQAADEALSGRFDDQFMVDIFQAGAGTSFHMNVNEVLANRALEILGKKRGDYDSLSPHDHVNAGQSTNDTFPTASHIAIIGMADDLLTSLQDLATSFEEKGHAFAGLRKSGRTHLMDALPLTLGDEFRAYGAALRKSAERIRQRRDDLLEVALGGTATGTGANAHPDFRRQALKNLGKLTGLPLKEAEDPFETLQSRSSMAAFSGALRELALELVRIANDLRLLSSGPVTGLGEITLPPVQPGSSIMAGKVNPVMAECLNMVSFQVIGNDTAVSLAAQAGQIDLNVMTPVMTANILQSLSLLKNFLPVFNARCVIGIKVDDERLRGYLQNNPMLATLLTPKIGYARAAEIAREAQEKKIAVRELVLRKGLVTEEEATRLLGPAERKN
ncbi:MAG: aspartate ammonia-lyase [Methanoregulaceae archaeon]|nr:aspartate ammonia-lyase [Methanoregulaceae archaeon]